MTLLWVLVVALALFGFADHLVWVAAGALAAVTLAVECLLVRRRRSAAARVTATGSRRA